MAFRFSFKKESSDGKFVIQPKRKRCHQEELVRKLWDSRFTNGDVSITFADGETGLYHSNVLSVSSEFFKGALESSKMHESSTGEIDFSQVCDKAVGEAMMEWIYFGALPIDRKVSPESLFVLAAYADVSSLVLHAGKLMIDQCVKENVAHIQTV